MRAIHTSGALRSIVLTAAVTALTAACGSDGGTAARTATPAAPAASSAAAESPYCDVARRWGLHELVPFDDRDPAAFRAYWAAYVAFNKSAQESSPAKLRDEWDLNVDAITTRLTPVFEKYGFDTARLEAEGTDAEKALAQDPPADVAAAQATIHEYESRVCASEQPPAANVDFSGEEKSAQYCDAVAAADEMAGKAGADQELVRKLATDPEFLDLLRQQHDHAPAALQADADALYTFWTGEQLPLLAGRGYDMRSIILDGPQADREVLNSTAPRIRDHYARAAAYQQQVCNG